MHATPAALTNQGDYCDAPGGRVWYRIIGTGSGTPLLVAHGGPGATHDYLLNHGRLGDQRPVVFWDQLESGNSDKPNDPSLWTIPRFVSEVDALRRHLALERVMLLGHSWGAAIAVEYAGARPSGLVACVLASPFIHARDWVADNALYVAALPAEVAATIASHEAAGTTESAEYEAALKIFYARHLCRVEPTPADMQRSFERLNEAVYHTMNGPSEFAVIGTLRDMDCSPRLRQIACPVLFTCGEFDEAAPSSVRRYAGMTPKARFEVFAGASHTPHLEVSDAYFTILADFLADADGHR
jgi:proline iminopeptidase